MIWMRSICKFSWKHASKLRIHTRCFNLRFIETCNLFCPQLINRGRQEKELFNSSPKIRNTLTLNAPMTHPVNQYAFIWGEKNEITISICNSQESRDLFLLKRFISWDVFPAVTQHDYPNRCDKRCVTLSFTLILFWFGVPLKKLWRQSATYRAY